MVNVDIICVGKMKEKFYTDAAAEYIKRLGAFCNIKITELAEAKRPSDPSPAETAAAIAREETAIMQAIPKGSAVIAMCIEGRQFSSEELADTLSRFVSNGASRLCFIIGGSDGMGDGVKARADLKLSMSKMTFPHHLARVMLLEQLYRSFSIQNGGKYHK